MNHWRRGTWGVLIVMGIALSGCGLWSALKEGEPPRETIESPQPTLNLDEIPVLGGADAAPPVPLFVDDPLFPIAPADGPAYEEGKQLYDRWCAACHGANGEGQPPDPLAPGAAPPHNGDGHTWHHADQQNFATVWQGRTFAGGVMPDFYDRLSPREIGLILAYIKTWWEPAQLEHQLTQTQQVIEGYRDAAPQSLDR